VAKTKHAFCGQ